jgi:hypothetical protein
LERESKKAIQRKTTSALRFSRSLRSHFIALERASLQKDTCRKTKCPALAANLNAMPDHWALLHGNAFNPDVGKLAQCKELSKCSDGPLWQKGNSQEIGRLAQGLGKLDPSIKGTNAMFFIDHKQVPKDRKVTHLNVVSAPHRPEKKDPHRMRWAVGGDQVDHPGDISKKTADLTTTNTLSTPCCPLQTQKWQLQL